MKEGLCLQHVRKTTNATGHQEINYRQLFLIWVIRHVHTYIELKYNLNLYPILYIFYFSADLKKKKIDNNILS